MSLSPDSPLPSHYQLANLNWHPTVDMKVQSYALEQSTKQLRNETEQLKKENARLAVINSRVDRFEQEHFSSLNQALSTGDSSAS
ncbi:hypothetical protein [Synechococcus lacustris]|uniref:hypothetical protein n=1 Tax=Synechococcus lacustris TaxID=2116544 RepID=UPI0020CBB064|nr:hypothetical protein [Synechococcus lacustris]MCP9814915.1 hypothetical protein [Synechococcus lacustris L1E-Slac]